jgi:hypothetical protein
MHAEHKDGDIRKFREDAAGRFDTVDLRESAIHDDYGGVEPLGEPDGFKAVAGFADDLDRGFIFENAAETTADEGVVVDKEYREFIWHGFHLFERDLP